MNTEMLKSYLKMLLKMFNADTDKKATMLLEMLKRANVEEGKLQLITNSTIKKQISELSNLSVSAVNNAISKFIKVGILERKDFGVYIFNPKYFGNTEWKLIDNIILRVVLSKEIKFDVEFGYKEL